MDESYLLSLPPEVQCRIVRKINYPTAQALNLTSTQLKDSVANCVTELVELDNQDIFTPTVPITVQFITNLSRLKRVSMMSYHIDVRSEKELISLAEHSFLESASLAINFDQSLAAAANTFFSIYQRNTFNFFFRQGLRDSIELVANDGLFNLTLDETDSDIDRRDLIVTLAKKWSISTYDGPLHDLPLANRLAVIPTLKEVTYWTMDEQGYSLKILLENTHLTKVMTYRDVDNADTISFLAAEASHSYPWIEEFIPVVIDEEAVEDLSNLFPNLKIIHAIIDPDEGVDYSLVGKWPEVILWIEDANGILILA